MAVQALLEDGDEVLIPAPDYPLWTAVTSLAGGQAVHYLCDEAAGWLPDLADMAAKITDRTRAVVIINPNNPTGAVYPRELLDGILDLARRHQLLVFADEIYDKILYDGVGAPLRGHARPGPVLPHLQRPVQGLPGGRLPLRLAARVRAQAARQGLHRRAGHAGRNAAVPQRPRPSTPSRPRSAAGRASPTWSCPAGGCTSSATGPGSASTRSRASRCVKPQGALYAFPRLDPAVHQIHDDEQFVLDLLLAREDPGRAGNGVQLAAPGPLPHPHPAARRRPRRRHRPHRPVPRRVPAVTTAILERPGPAMRPARWQRMPSPRVRTACEVSGRNGCPRRGAHGQRARQPPRVQECPTMLTAGSPPKPRRPSTPCWSSSPSWPPRWAITAMTTG